MAFKYQSSLNDIPNCPAAGFSQRAAISYRYVTKEDVTGSFLPILALKPARAIKMDDTERCSGWALSFFTSVATARAKFTALQRVNPKIHKTLGNAVAEGTLYPKYGASSDADADGHFELHELEDVELGAHFVVVETLV